MCQFLSVIEVKLFRDKLKQTQTQFAADIGTTPTRISIWENGGEISPAFCIILDMHSMENDYT